MYEILESSKGLKGIVVNRTCHSLIEITLTVPLKVSFFLLKVAHKTKESLKVPFLLLKLGLEIAPNHELNELFLKLGQEIVSEPEMQGPVLRVLSLADTQQGLEPFLVDIAQEEMFGVASFLYNSVQDSASQPGEEHGPIPVMNERPSQSVSGTESVVYRFDFDFLHISWSKIGIEKHNKCF